MNKENITKGEWVANYNEYFWDIKLNNKNSLAHTIKNNYINISQKEEEANAQLIAEAGTVFNKCGLTPSELLGRYEYFSNINKESMIDDYMSKATPFTKGQDYGLLKTQLYGLLEYAINKTKKQ